MKEISVQAAKTLLETENDVQLIDVRTLHEHEADDIGGKLIPLQDLQYRLQELDRNKVTILYCQAGVRSLWAAEMLQAAGFQYAYSLTGGIAAWHYDDEH